MLAIFAVIAGLLSAAGSTFVNPSAANAATGEAATATSAVQHAKLMSPRMAPGNPGVPGDPTVLYKEDFENGTAGANVGLPEYVGTDGATYAASAYWQSRDACNGFIIDFTSPRVAGDCNAGRVEPGGAGTFSSLQALTYAIGQIAGQADPENNAAVASYTAGSTTNNEIQFEVQEPLQLAAANRFVTFSVDAVATSCFSTHPQLRFYLVNDAGTEIPVSNTAIDPCDDSRGTTVDAISPDGTQLSVSGGTFVADSSLLVAGDSLGIVLRNENGSGAGNDGAYDNIRVLDVSPQLDKSFSPVVAYAGGVSTLTFTVTNTSELAAKSGWAFTDNLPEGLSVAGSPNVGGTCVADVAADGSTIAITNGVLAAGEASCTITVDVTSPVIGSFENCAANISDVVGIDLPACATVAFLGRDFGDAPASYNTGDADGGPSHLVPEYDADGSTSPIMLGSSIDVEDDGQPTDLADGDDSNGVSDEDGVDFNSALGYTTPTLRTGLDPASLQPIENTLDVTASADGFVSVWVDWNQDGTFTEDERVANAQPVSTGANEVSFAQGVNPDSISSFVRVRYSTDAASIAAPTGSAPDGEVEDYRVLIERVVTPDVCVADDVEYSAFTFGEPVDITGTGGTGSSARFGNVTVINGVAVDMVITTLEGTMFTGVNPPNGIGNGDGGVIGADDAMWNIRLDANLEYQFYEAGTTTPVDVNAVFTVNDMDGPPDVTQERATFDSADIAGYAISEGSTVDVREVDGSIVFEGNGNNDGDVASRFQVTLEGVSSFQARWQGFASSGFGFDGDDDLAIDPPSCADFGDAPDSYGTTLGADGARHQIVAGVSLGDLIDFDADGQPSDDATGDDENRVADEDGVQFNSALGYTTPTLRTGLDPASLQPIENTLDVTASADGFVSVWVDWNQDGTFTEDERVANAQPVTAGANQVSFTQGENPDSISSFVRVRYSTDAASIAAPTGAAPDGEVEDYRVIFERLVMPDVCTASGAEHYAFTFNTPVDLTGTDGEVGTTARYENVTVINGVAVDMFVEVVEGQIHTPANPPNGFGVGTSTQIAPDDAAWNVNAVGATIRYTFYEAGTTDPVDINAVFTVNDLDGAYGESATFDGADLTSYAVTQGSLVEISEGASGAVTFSGGGAANLPGTPETRFQVVLEGLNTFDVAWTGVTNSGFGFDGDGDLSIDPPACSDFGDAPDSYGTTLDADGARHQIVSGLSLGSEVDFDADGQPTDDATGDDANRLADEDGVASPIVATVGSSTSVTVSATNDTDAAATIAGWIDLDGNGTFDAGELVTVAVPANSGTADYVLTFLAGTTTDDTFARFRLFPGDVTAFSPTGAATAGEIEDYAVTVLERELDIEKTSDMTADSRPGDTVEYTVTATNTGTGDYTTNDPAVIFDDLAGVLDDAEYNSDAVAEASDGSDVSDPSFLAPSFLSWSGPLAAGESVTITYTVTLTGGGDGTVRNVAWQPNTPPPPGTPPTEIPTCDPASPDETDPVTGEPCGATETVMPKLSVDKTSDVADLPADGGEVTYTVTVTNEGPGAYTEDAPATMTDDLSEVLDDAEFGEITAPADGAVFDEDAQEITWSGALAAGESVEITYTVTYDSTTGDNVLFNVACIPAADAITPGADCAEVRVPAAALTITKSADPADGTRVVAGQEVTYTVGFASTGTTDAAVDVIDDLSNVFDDATFVEGSIVTSDPALTATLNGDALTVTGSVPAGETYTVSYTVIVNAYADQDDHTLGNVVTNPDGSCQLGGCPETEHVVRHISVTKAAAPTEGVQAGDTVTYTVTVTNDGEADYTAVDPATVLDDMSGVLDDATFNGDAVAVASDGTPVPAPVFTSPALGWAGPLAVGESVTITYTVTVTNLGDSSLLNTAGPVCAEGEICDPPTTVDVLVPKIVPAKTSDPVSGEAVNAGDVVTYTLSWTNDGQAAGPVDSTDDLSNVLDDGAITSDPVVDDAHADAVTAVLDLDAQTIRVTGDLAPGETTTVTYQVTIGADGERGDNIAGNVLTPDVPPYVCEEGDAECDPFVPPTTDHTIGELDDWKTVDPASGSTVQPGQVMTYTLSFENTGEAPVPVNRDDVLTQVLDDATVTTAPSSSDAALTVSEITDGRFNVTGSLEPGQVVTVTYTVTVNADGARGDDRLGNFLVGTGEEPPAECVPADEERADCTVNHVSNLVVSKSSDPASGTAVNPGESVTYTLTFENVSTSAAADDVAIDYTDHMVDVLDDATLQAGPTSSNEAVTAATEGDTIRITGAVGSGETVTVTYTVVVKAYDQQGNHALGNVVAVTGEEPVCAPDSPLCTTHNLPEPPPLASTGGEITWWVLATALMLLTGGGVLMIARRRRAEENAEAALIS